MNIAKLRAYKLNTPISFKMQSKPDKINKEMAQDADNYAWTYAPHKKRETVDNYHTAEDFYRFATANVVKHWGKQNPESQEGWVYTSVIEHIVRDADIESIHTLLANCPSQEAKDQIALKIFEEYSTDRSKSTLNSKNKNGEKPSVKVLLAAIKYTSPKVQEKFPIEDVLESLYTKKIYDSTLEDEIDTITQIGQIINEDASIKLIDKLLNHKSYLRCRDSAAFTTKRAIQPMVEKAYESDKIPRILRDKIDCYYGSNFSI